MLHLTGLKSTNSVDSLVALEPWSILCYFHLYRYSMIYALLGVSAGHGYRMCTDYGGFSLDFSG